MTFSYTFLLLLFITVFTVVRSDNYCGSSNCYELLQVPRDADENTIKKAYRELAKKYHPDKNQKEDTTQLFQLINKAYETLTDEKLRFKYDLHLQNPDESDFYHEYRYYQKKFIQDPKIHPAFVIIVVLILISGLQFIMRKQMYERAIQQITQSHDFKNKVNERCGSNKRLKESIKEEMIREISIQGGYSMPTYKDILLYKIIVLPVTIFNAVFKWSRWVWKYNIKKEEYSQEDQIILTIKSLSLSPKRWENIPEPQRNLLIQRKLWIKQNKAAYDEEMKQKWLEQLKNDKPRQYQLVMKHLKKNQ